MDVSVETTIVTSPNACGIFANGSSSSLGQLIEIYSTEVPASRGVIELNRMIHMSVEVAVVMHPSAWGIFSNSPSSIPAEQPAQIYSTGILVQRKSLGCLLTIIQSVGRPYMKIYNSSEWSDRPLTPYGCLLLYLQNWTTKHGHVGL